MIVNITRTDLSDDPEAPSLHPVARAVARAGPRHPEFGTARLHTAVYFGPPELHVDDYRTGVRRYYHVPAEGVRVGAVECPEFTLDEVRRRDLSGRCRRTSY